MSQLPEYEYSEELDKNIYELFQLQVNTRPDDIAIIADDETVSYAQLDQIVDRVCSLLAPENIAAEQIVGVLMARSVEMIATMLALFKIGAAFLPLDPDEPGERHSRIIGLAGCRLIVATDCLLQTIVKYHVGEETKFVDIENLSSITLDNEPKRSASGGERLAYILFTSGSTGEPKGVAIEHRSAVNLLLAGRDLLGFTPADRFLAVATIAFDASIAEIFIPLVSGGSVVLRDRSIMLDAPKLAEVIEQSGASIIQTGPLVWMSILSALPEFPRIRVVISTGEALSPDVARKLNPYGEQVLNLYGPTEATVWTTVHRIIEHDYNAGNSLSISVPLGQTITNSEVLILNEDLQPVDGNESGQICIAGAGLARGYLNSKNMTDEKFVFHQQSGKRIYLTGDLGYRGDDGLLHYLGRNDDQLQIRGVRVEPREVESAILSNPNVRETAATWYESVSGGRSIVAAVVLEPKVTLSSEQLYVWLRTRLSPQMIPSRFIFEESLVLTASGKVDRNVIRDQVVIASPDNSELIDSLSTTEKELIQIWKRLLAIESVTQGDHFFSIGGDSLVAVRMILDVEAAFKVDLSVQTIFEAPTLKQFAQEVDNRRAVSSNSANTSYVYRVAGSDDSRPLFFHNAHLSLAEKWKLPSSLYALSHWANGSGFMEVSTLSELAKAQITAIRKIQPEGPYRIGGFSFGGLVALEIAKQLRKQGQEVDMLFLLDPMHPPYIDSDKLVYKKESIEARTIRHFKGIMKEPEAIFSYLGVRAKATFSSLGARAKARVRSSKFFTWLNYQVVHFHSRHQNRLSRLLMPQDQWPAFSYFVKKVTAGYTAESYSGQTFAVFTDANTLHKNWMELLGAGTAIYIANAGHLDLFNEPFLSQWMIPLEERLKVK